MTTFLRTVYEALSCFSTATHTAMCNDFLRKLRAKSDDNLACYFTDAIEANKAFCQIDQPFIPKVGRNNKGTNPVANVMRQSNPLVLSVSPENEYEFTYLQREIPHLRAMTKKEQDAKAWIDYVAWKRGRPILGEIKWEDDENPFYAFIQLLTYLSEMATSNQIERAIKHKLFGNDITTITAFDLHIFLANYNDRGTKGPLIELTRQLASAFKRRLKQYQPETEQCLGNVLCFSADIKNESNCFSKVSCRWMV